MERIVFCYRTLKRSAADCVFQDILHNGKGGRLLDNGIVVILFEKQPNGELNQIDERTWQLNMIASLEHVNYVTVGGQEYETVEGRLNLDSGKLEILVVPMRNH